MELCIAIGFELLPLLLQHKGWLGSAVTHVSRHQQKPTHRSSSEDNDSADDLGITHRLVSIQYTLLVALYIDGNMLWRQLYPKKNQRNVRLSYNRVALIRPYIKHHLNII